MNLLSSEKTKTHTRTQHRPNVTHSPACIHERKGDIKLGKINHKSDQKKGNSEWNEFRLQIEIKFNQKYFQENESDLQGLEG
jgi:hypothetical protein